MKRPPPSQPPRLTRGEYWLLESVVRGGMAIGWLDWPGLEECLNKPGHGLDRPTLVETLWRLFSDGLISASRQDSSGEVSQPDREAIEASLHLGRS